MAGVGGSLLTLGDAAKRHDPSGKTAKVVELLEQVNDVVSDVPWLEGNLPTGHRTTVRTGLPAPTWRLLNKGVAATKSTTAQIDEGVGRMEIRTQIDKAIAELNGDLNAFRMSEARPSVEGMAQEFAQTLFYGNTSLAPEEFHGLAIRYSSLSANNAQNIVNAESADTDNSSIWLICWGEQTVHGIYPKGSKAGLDHEDLGLCDAFDSSNNRFRAYMDRWEWVCGIALRDWRFAVRIANIDISNLGSGTSAADLQKLMIKAIHRIPGGYAGLRMGKPVFYMNRSCFQALDIQRRDDVIQGGGLTYANADGVPVASFRGVPVRVCDALVENESLVS